MAANSRKNALTPAAITPKGAWCFSIGISTGILSDLGTEVVIVGVLSVKVLVAFEINNARLEALAELADAA